jgi:hypothetical protein
MNINERHIEIAFSVSPLLPFLPTLCFDFLQEEIAMIAATTPKQLITKCDNGMKL